jgi:hypothetical protein
VGPRTGLEEDKYLAPAGNQTLAVQPVAMPSELCIALLYVCFLLLSCLAYRLILKMETTCTSETSFDFQ